MKYIRRKEGNKMIDKTEEKDETFKERMNTPWQWEKGRMWEKEDKTEESKDKWNKENRNEKLEKEEKGEGRNILDSFSDCVETLFYSLIVH